ncbi:MAG: hypothetical protein ACOCQD_01790 [archaeon]
MKGKIILVIVLFLWVSYPYLWSSIGMEIKFNYEKENDLEEDSIGWLLDKNQKKINGGIMERAGIGDKVTAEVKRPYLFGFIKMSPYSKDFVDVHLIHLLMIYGGLVFLILGWGLVFLREKI